MHSPTLFIWILLAAAAKDSSINTQIMAVRVANEMSTLIGSSAAQKWNLNQIIFAARVVPEI